MNITEFRSGQILTLTVTGLVDADNSYRLCDAVAAATESRAPLVQVVLDVTDADFADFAVTGLLRRLCEQAAAVGASYELHGASPKLATIVATSGLGADIHLS